MTVQVLTLENDHKKEAKWQLTLLANVRVAPPADVTCIPLVICGE